MGWQPHEFSNLKYLFIYIIKLAQTFLFQFGNARWRAVKVFEQMYEKNELKKSFIRWMHPEEDSPDLDDDLTFIKELILGRPLNGKVGAVFPVLHGSYVHPYAIT